MKKFFYLFAVAFVLTLSSCSFFEKKESPASSDTVADTTAVAADSTATADTTKVMITP